MPLQQIDDGPWPIRVGMLGVDHPGLRPAFKVKPGDQVAVGDVLLTDRRHAAIACVSPIAGTVAETEYGPRRTLARIVIEGDRGTSDGGDANDDPLEATSDDAIRAVLQARGLWLAFRSRPFGLVPAPDARPDAIFVNAVRAGSHRPDPAIVLEGRVQDLRHGLSLLTALTAGTVHLCQDDGARLCSDTPERVRVTRFSGSPAAALSGTHVHRLHPVGDDATVWTVDYQDVAAMGALFRTGRFDGMRTIALTGPRAARPRLVRVPLGADLRAVTEGEVNQPRRDAGVRVLSGGAVGGRPSAFLGRHDDQVCIVAAERPRVGWRGRRTTVRRALVPSAGLDRALPFSIMAVPLMRALAVGDTEAAQRLGCLELIEEDVALLTRRCTSGADYGALLRDILDEIAKDAA